MVNATPRPLYPQERSGTHCIGGWGAPGPVWTGCGKSRPNRIRSPDRPARSESIYRLRYPGPPRRFYRRGEKPPIPIYRWLGGPRGRSVKGPKNLTSNRCSSLRPSSPWRVAIPTELSRPPDSTEVLPDYMSRALPRHQCVRSIRLILQKFHQKLQRKSNVSPWRTKKCQEFLYPLLCFSPFSKHLLPQLLFFKQEMWFRQNIRPYT